MPLSQIELIAEHGRIKEEAPEDMALLIRDMSVAYGSSPVVLAANVGFRKGRMAAIVGPNGAGKSSLLKAALGIVKPLAGEALFFGQPFKEVRSLVSYVPQRAAIDWDFPARVIDVVMMGLTREIGLFRLAGRKEREKAFQALDEVGMAELAQRQIGQLSGGQQQRVFLARALVQRPELYLLDEPFAGVDVATEAAIIALLHRLRGQGATIIAVHHALPTVARYFDDVTILNRRVIASGSVGDVMGEENLKLAYGRHFDAASLKPDEPNA